MGQFLCGFICRYRMTNGQLLTAFADACTMAGLCANADQYLDKPSGFCRSCDCRTTMQDAEKCTVYCNSKTKRNK